VERLDDDDSELAALRRRAYAADADIAADPVAQARLAELEELARLGRAADASQVEAHSVEARVEESTPAPAPGTITVTAFAPAIPRPGRPRWHTALVAGTAVVAVALGVSAWSERPSAAPTANPASEAVADPASEAVEAFRDVEDIQWGSSSEAYMEFLDSLRDDVLAGASPHLLARRIIRDELRPYGGMNGRAVWAGPTTDGELCLVVSDPDAPVIACGYPETIEASGVSIVLPAGRADSQAESVFPPGQSIRYTLGPGLSVTAQPAVD